MGVLRPIARVVRVALTPAPKPLQFTWQSITAGPAAGTTALLPDGTAISQAITSGRYEADVLAVVQSLVKDQDVCFDIGGHYGCFTLSLAKMATGGQVHTFEPVAAHADRIAESAERSGLSHVTVHCAAVAGEVGELTLNFADVPGSDDSMAYLDQYGGVDTDAAAEHYGQFKRTIVRATTLDALHEELPPPSFVKIDAEGAEGPIVGSGLQMIADRRPRMLIELHGIQEALSCAELLESVNYRAILLTDKKVNMPVLWVPHDDDEALQSVRQVLGHQPIVLFDQRSNQA